MKFKVEVVRVGTPGAVYVGRPSALGNPFVLRHEAERDAVCNQYAKHFAKLVEDKDERVMTEL